jgi:hypothetical protein
MLPRKRRPAREKKDKLHHFFKIALVLVRFDHVASFITNPLTAI